MPRDGLRVLGRFPSLYADNDMKVYLAWRERGVGSNVEVRYAEWTEDEGWSPARTVVIACCPQADVGTIEDTQTFESELVHEFAGIVATRDNLHIITGSRFFNRDLATGRLTIISEVLHTSRPSPRK